MQDSRQQIIHNFSLHAEHYDQHAHVQKYAAARLCSYVKELKITPNSTILEIGCGTGFVSEQLIGMFPDCTYIITDISPGMLKQCRDNLVKKEMDLESVYFQVLDGETIKSFERYDLIVSGLTVQWFDDFPSWLRQGIATLRTGSTIALSYLSGRSFPEWKDSCRQTGIPYSGNALPDHDLLKKISANRDVRCLWESEFKTLGYDSLLHFFSELKRIGASCRMPSQGKCPSVSGLRELNHFHSNGKGCEVSHHLVYGIITV
ncbi:MAG: methyltransferase domain-containing protein [Balneolales bacterium]